MTATLDGPVATAADPAPAVERQRPPRSPLMTAGLVMVGIVVLVAVFAPLLASYDPTNARAGAVLETPSARHWLGTDRPGRDLFAQLVYGARASLIVAVAAGTLAMGAAILVGVLPALLGGGADTISNRLVVFLLALPGLPLLILIGSLAGKSRAAVIVMIAFTQVAPNARILRSQAITLRERGFISAARGFGGGPLYVLRRHLVPGLAPLIIVGFVNTASIAIALEAGLAFIGIGDPSSISWGMTLSRALSEPNIYFSAMWAWWVLPAGFAIAATVLGFTFIGVGLEPSLNPRWLRSS